MTTQTPTVVSPTRVESEMRPAAPAATALADIPTAPGVVAAGDDDLPAGFTLDIRSVLALLPDDDALDDWFFRFTEDNEHLGCQFEIDQEGNLIAMASESIYGWRGTFGLNLCYFDLSAWNGRRPWRAGVSGQRSGQDAAPGPPRGRCRLDCAGADYSVAAVGLAISRHTLCPPLHSGTPFYFQFRSAAAGENGGMAGLRGGAGVAD